MVFYIVMRPVADKWTGVHYHEAARYRSHKEAQAFMAGVREAACHFADRSTMEHISHPDYPEERWWIKMEVVK